MFIKLAYRRMDNKLPPPDQAGSKVSLTVSTFPELHTFIVFLVAILETVFKLGVVKGKETMMDTEMMVSDDSDDTDDETNFQVCPNSS